MILTEQDFLDINEHCNGCNIDGLEYISYEEKKKRALEEANAYVSGYDSNNEAWKAIRENKECFTEAHGYIDTGRLYLGMAVLTADKDTPNKVYWDVRED